MSGLEPILSNPTLGYRLDPYEPGLIRHAKASQSTAQVVSHEQRNLTRLSRQAIQEGRVIIRKQITYRPTIAGSYMGTAAGRTTVVSMEKGRPEEENPLLEMGRPEEENPSSEPEGSQEKYPSDLIGEGNEEVYNSAQPELARLSAKELSQKEQTLRMEIRRITTEMEQLEGEKDHSSDEVAPFQAEQDQGKLEFELERKRQELQEVVLAKILKSQSELLAFLNEGLVNSLQAAMSIIKVAYNASSNPVGGNFDLFI